MGRSDPPRRVSSRLSDGGVCRLTPHRVLWYSAVQSKRPFKIPIPNDIRRGQFTFLELTLENGAGVSTSSITVKEPIKLLMRFEASRDIEDCEISLRISNLHGQRIFTANRSTRYPSRVDAGQHVLEAVVPPLLLVPGGYSMDIAAHIPNVELLDYQEGVLRYRVDETGSEMTRYSGVDFGVVLIQLQWTERTVN